MLLRSLKIASQSGHRWAGIFRRLSAKFSDIWRNKPNVIRSKVDVYEGFIAKHSLVGGRVTTRVVDPTGFLLGITDPTIEGYFTSPLSQSYLWPGFPRDIFAPEVPIPNDFEPLPKDGSFTLRESQRFYPVSAGSIGSTWPGGKWFFTVGCPTDSHGITASVVMSNLTNPATGANFATISNSATFGAVFEFFAGKRGRTLVDMFRLTVYENALPAGFYMAPRMVPQNTSGGAFSATTLRMPRQIPVPSGVRDKGRCLGVYTITESPVRTAFDYACGEAGIIMTGLSIFKDGSAQLANVANTISGLMGPAVAVEPWDDEKPWVQEFTTVEERQWFNPDTSSNETIEVEITHKVYYPVGGLYKRAEIPFQAKMPNHIGTPVAAIFEDRVEVYTDFRVTRTWVDERGDFYPTLTPITIQTQTGIAKITLPYTLNEEEGTTQFGPMSNTHIVSDISGAVENGSFDALGGDREDYHRLYRVRWAGNVGGHSVVIASMVKHKRWEAEPQNPIPEGGPVLSHGSFTPRFTAQSNINRNLSARWEFSYQTPNGATVNGGANLGSNQAVKIPGDDGDGMEWQDAIGVVMIVDGVVTEWDAKTLGWCLLRTFNAQQARDDDWRWEVTTHKWAVAISDTEIALCAYSFPYVPGITTCKLLTINVLSGAITLLRTDNIPSANARPAITCYQRRVVKGDKVMEPCMIYRLGAQVGAGWMELTKDGGATWTRIWDDSASPGMGAFYVGSPVWTPEYGEVFRPYM